MTQHVVFVFFGPAVGKLSTPLLIVRREALNRNEARMVIEIDLAGGLDPENTGIVEIGLATRRANDGSDLFEQRRLLMGMWADYCQHGQDAKVVPLRA